MLGKNSKKVKKNLCLNKELIIELQVKMVKQGVKTSLSNMIDAIILDYDKKNLSLTYLKYQEFLREEKEEWYLFLEMFRHLKIVNSGQENVLCHLKL